MYKKIPTLKVNITGVAKIVKMFLYILYLCNLTMFCTYVCNLTMYVVCTYVLYLYNLTM